MEHLRAAERRSCWNGADVFCSFGRQEPELRQWCAEQMPAIEVVALLNVSPTPTSPRTQLDEWRKDSASTALRWASG